MPQRGFLLLNLGTPRSLSYLDIYRFLSQFLSDWRVLDIPALIRYPLVYGVIALLRPWKVRKAYQSIWDNGSPLMTHSTKLLSALKNNTGLPMALGMTYQQPSIKEGLKELLAEGCDEIIVLPLFPQYAAASSGAAIGAVYAAAAQMWDPPVLRVIKDFYIDKGYISAQAQLIKDHAPQECDLLVFSFHGVPIRQLEKSGCSGATLCQKQDCPASFPPNCYRSQCFATARAIMADLGWDKPFRVAFQSRLGPIPWIKPYLDHALESWADEGFKNIVVASPSFTADCLETLEEIGEETREEWESLTQGQGSLTALPCLNTHPLWVETLSQWALAVAEGHQPL